MTSSAMNEETIEEFLNAAEFQHYGCGYDSFVDVLVTHPDRSEQTRSRDDYLTTHGLSLLLCRLAPIAALLTDGERGHGPVGNGHASAPESASLSTSPVAGWDQESRAITAVLNRYGVTLVHPDVLQQPVLTGLSIETNLSGPSNGFDLFDAWFHWTD